MAKVSFSCATYEQMIVSELMLNSTFPLRHCTIVNIRVLQYEHDQRLRLEEMVETLAKQHSSLERQARKNAPCSTLPHGAAATSTLALNAEPTRKPSSTHQGGAAGASLANEGAASAASGDANPSPVNELTASSSSSAQQNAASSNASEDDDDEFFDVMEEAEEFNIPLRFGPSAHQRSESAVSAASSTAPADGTDDVSSTESDMEEGRVVTVRTKTKKQPASVSPVPNGSAVPDAEIENPALDPALNSNANNNTTHAPARIRRSALTPKPNYPLNLWGIMKNCIGKELSKIPMPVNFSEPLSMLQRLTEDLEYSEILDQAATMKDSRQQLAYIAAFTVSSYATTTVRTTKPFNPLLGETYECDRTDDRGWKLITEQVSHHPPAAAQHVESDKWELWQEFTMSSKFRGKYLQIIPLGLTHLRFKDSGNHYTWRKGTCGKP